MRVVQVGCVRDPARRPPPALLAAWPTLPDIAPAAAGAGAEVFVVQASHDDVVHVQGDVTYHFVRSGAGLRPWLADPAPIAAAVRALAPDLIHLHGLDFPRHARALSRLGMPLLAQDHGSRPAGMQRFVRHWGYRDTAGFAFTAAAQAQPFVDAGHLPVTARIFEIPESSTRFTPGDPAAARASTGLDGDPLLLWVGRLDENKDPLTILRAVGLALPHLPGLRLCCCFGEDRLLPEIRRRLAGDPALAARVELRGKVPHAEVENLCRAADVFLLGSAREGSGYALIEAIACGATPVVSTIPSFRALTGNGAIGRLVPRGDAQAFAAAFVGLATASRDALRAAARAHFERHLSFDVVGTKLVQAYRTLLREARGS